MYKEIFDKLDNGLGLNREDALTLLSTDNHSPGYYSILSKANALSRSEYGKRGYVFAQIGIDAKPCSGNCKFCSLAKDTFSVKAQTEKSLEDILTEATQIAKENVDALFLMTTADYAFKKYLDIAQKVKKILPTKTELVANIGDFDLEQAKKLKSAGFSAVYHIVRLGEGKDTDLPVQQRIQTLDAIKAAGLALYYCIEPIGPEHTYEEIVDEMMRARDYDVDVMAVMRRVDLPNTPHYSGESLTDLEITKIAAVTRLVTRPKTSMNIHEPLKLALIAGVNQLYAEIGVNPRDQEVNTEKNRGFTLSQIRDMLTDAGYSNS